MIYEKYVCKVKSSNSSFRYHVRIDKDVGKALMHPNLHIFTYVNNIVYRTISKIIVLNGKSTLS